MYQRWLYCDEIIYIQKKETKLNLLLLVRVIFLYKTIHVKAKINFQKMKN